MGNVFLASDLHLGHKGMCVFTNYDGSKLRPWDDTDEMDEALIDNWNKVVKPHDKVYNLGDVVINRKKLEKYKRLNGKHRLIRGNHDIFRTSEYLEVGFEEIYGVRVLDDMILSHIPLHEGSITARYNCNVHGHLHGNRVKISNTTDNHPRYFCVSMEHINFTPIALEDLRVILKKQFENAGLEYGKVSGRDM